MTRNATVGRGKYNQRKTSFFIRKTGILLMKSGFKNIFQKFYSTF